MAFKRDAGSYDTEGLTTALTTHVISDEISIQNKTNDIIVLNIAIDGGRTLVVPTGWTSLKQNTDKAFSQHIFWRRTTSDNESMPDLVFDSGTASEMSCSAISILGCPTSGSPFGSTATAASGTSVTPFWNTIENTTQHSAIIWIGGSDRRPWTEGAQGLTDITSGANQVATTILYEYQNEAVTDYGQVDGKLSQSDGFQTEVLELLDGGDDRTPTYFESVPGKVMSTDDYTIDQSARALFDTSTITLEGDTKETYSFVSGDVDTGNDVINIAISDHAHKRVFKATGGSLPSGMTDGRYYYLLKNSSSEMYIADAGTDTGSTNLGNTPTAISLGSTGSGTFTESGIIHMSIGTDGDYDRPSSNHNKENNFIGSVQTLGTAKDFSNEVFGTGFRTVNNGYEKLLLVAFDENDNWKSWNLGSGLLSMTAPVPRIVDFSNTTTDQSYGSFDVTAVTSWGWFFKTTGSGKKPRTVITAPYTVKPIVVLGGDSISPVTFGSVFEELNIAIADTSSNPSALQYLFLHSLQFGNHDKPLVFEDSEKSVAFPPLADGVTNFDAYLNNLGVTIDLSATDSMTFRNSQIGSNAPFGFDISNTHSSSSTLLIGGTTLVQGTATFNSTDTIDSLLFVGGEGITHNNCVLTNCTFDSIGRADGYLELTTSHNMSSCSFKANVATDHAIEIATAGSYSFDDLSFSGFTASLNATHTTGTVTINVLNGGATPTLDGTWTDNGSGNFTKGSATVVIQNAVTLKASAFDASTSSGISGARVLITAAAGGSLSVGTEILSGLTDSNGELTDSTFNFSSDQPVTGKIRKSSSTPFYKTGLLSGTITSGGLDVSAFLVRDE